MRGGDDTPVALWWEQLGRKDGDEWVTALGEVGSDRSSGNSSSTVTVVVVVVMLAMAGAVPFYKLRKRGHPGYGAVRVAAYRRAQARAFVASSMVLAVILGSTLLPLLYWKSGFLKAQVMRTRHTRTGSFRPSCTFIGGKRWLYGTPDTDMFNAQSFCELGAVCFEMDAKNSKPVLGEGGYDSATMEETCDAVFDGEVIREPEILDCAAERRRLLVGPSSGDRNPLGIFPTRLRLVQRAYLIVDAIGDMDPFPIKGTTVILPHDAQLETIQDYIKTWGQIYQLASNTRKLGLKRIENLVMPDGYEKLPWQESLFSLTLGERSIPNIGRLVFKDLARKASFKPICFENVILLSRSPQGGMAFANASAIDTELELSVPVDSLRMRKDIYEHVGINARGLTATFSEEPNLRLDAPTLKIGVMQCAYLPFERDHRYRQEPGFCVENFEELFKELKAVAENFRFQIFAINSTAAFQDQVRQMYEIGILVAPYGAYLTNTMFMRPASTLIEIRTPSGPGLNLVEFHGGSNGGIFHHTIQNALLHLPALSHQFTSNICADPLSEKCILAKKNGNLVVPISEIIQLVRKACLRLRKLHPILRLRQASATPFGHELTRTFHIVQN